MSHTRKPFALLATLLFLVCGVSAVEQETTATITGRVTDQAGAVISNAEVTLTNIRTRTARTAKTSDDGYYTLTLIQPGVYDLTVRAQQGFKEYQSKGIELFVNDRKTLNVSLEAGAVDEVMTVTGDAPIIQTSPTIGDVIENRRVVELPLNNRNFMQLVTLVPGVSSSGTSEVGIGLTNIVNLSINGTRRNSINWLVDGVSNTDVGSNITLLSVPTVDSIQEFRVITSLPTAEFGRAAGGVVNLVTRSGTRDLHGGVYEFLRNDKLNANSFFNNAAGRFGDRNELPAGDPRIGNERSPRSTLRYNNFGWNLGGPVYIPGVYQQRDKSFFFFSQEWRRIIRAPSEAIIRVPSLRERAGDFSESGQLIIIDPVTGQQFPGNRIPANRIDPSSASILALFPEPNVASLTAGRSPDRFSVTNPNIQNTRQETVRADHHFSENHHLTGRYTHDLSQTREQGGLFFGVSVPNIATTDTSVPGHVLATTLTSTFGPDIVNEVSFNFSGNRITTDLLGQWTRDNVSIANNELFPENNAGRPPTINTGLGVLGAGQGFVIEYNNFNPKWNLTWIKGAHTLKFGADISWEQKNENASNETQGRFTFSGLQTRSGAGTGIAFADFLLGRASSYSESEIDITNHLRFGRTEFYAQDTWKARPNLQVDYGVRYYLFRMPKDTENVLTAFFPELFNPANALQCANTRCSIFNPTSGDLLNGIVVAGRSSPFDRRVQELDKNDFGPRFGFAWDPWNDSKMVVRGGYGIYYDQVLVGIVEQNAFVNPPFASSISLSGTVASPITYANPAAGTPPATIGARSLITTSNPFITPIVQQWSLTVQRELSGKASFEVGYSGSGGNHLTRPVDINAPTPQEILSVSQGVAGCDPALGASNNQNNCINLARPFRGYGAITDRQTTATSRYHGLLSSFKMQDVLGITAQVAYTYSKTITDATNDRDAIDIPQIRTNFAIERAVSRLDRTHIFVASYVYEIPYAKSGFMASPFARHIFGGWEIAGITTAQTGLPLSRIIQDTAPGPRGNRANIVGDPFSNIPTGVSGGTPYLFNPLAFRPPAVGEIGDSARSLIRLPRQVFTDLHLSKNWRWGENYRIQFRAEFFNVFNNTIFDGAGQTLPSGRLPNDPIFNSLDAFLATGSSLGRFTAARNPREIQFGLKFNF
ncbi:MAG: carboxypeptidase regulatory-like domain-containing protein [Blastocatellia bacterium]|nr:carboxypeptidase regulatory-like domain-containing protein [Blastocatellia bacterium]